MEGQREGGERSGNGRGKAVDDQTRARQRKGKLVLLLRACAALYSACVATSSVMAMSCRSAVLACASHSSVEVRNPR